MNNETLAIVVTYNRKELLFENIQALMKQTRTCDILIVDNNSVDGTEKSIKGFVDGDSVVYLNTGKNIGGAGGFSVGMRYALTKGYKYAWLMDDDTIPDSNALESLESKAYNLKDNFSFLSSRVTWTDGSLCLMNVQYLPETVNDNFCHLREGIVPVKLASFVSFFANCNVAKSVGLPIKEFFIYGDDWEYSLRMNSQKPSYLDYDSVVTHKMKQNCGANVVTCDRSRIDRCYYNIRNTYYIEKEYFSKNHLRKYWLHQFKTLVEIKRSSTDSKIKRCSVVLKGMRDGRRFNPNIEYVE